MIPPYFLKVRLTYCGRCHYQKTKVALRRYWQSAKGKAAQARYQKSAKGRSSGLKHNKTPKGKARRLRHAVKLIRVANRYYGTAKNAAEAQRIRAYVKQRLKDFTHAES